MTKSNTLRPALWAIVAILIIWASLLAASHLCAADTLSLLTVASVDLSASIATVGAAAAGAKGLRDAVGDWSGRGMG